MNGVAALLIGGAVAYFVNAFLGEGTLKRIVSIIIGLIVMGFAASL